MGSAQQTYKVRLTSGRVLGPLDIERIHLLIVKGQIQGSESIREYPQGDWKPITEVSEIAELLLEQIQQDFLKETGKKENPSVDLKPIAEVNVQGTTAMLPGATPVQSIGPLVSLPDEGVQPQIEEVKQAPEPVETNQAQNVSIENEEPEERTMMGSIEEMDDEDHTRIADANEVEALSLPALQEEVAPQQQISQQKTILFQRSEKSPASPKKKNKGGLKETIKTIALALALGMAGYDLFFDEPEVKLTRLPPVRPELPAYVRAKSDPNKSIQIYIDAMKFYLSDTVEGYRRSAEKLRESASYDSANVKALAMLASSYINMIDSSNKDENYFSVLSKLIEMSRAKAIDLPETVIADVEFYLVVNKAEAAQNRIVEYTMTHQNFGLEMFYYLALCFYSRGDGTSAARYISQYPDNKVFSAKVFYLKGQIAEMLNDNQSALQEYEKAIKFNPSHAKSHLKIAELYNKQGKLKESASHLDFLMTHIRLLSPADLALAYFLHAQLSELFKNFDVALGDVERAVKLNPDNHDYLLELYTLRAKAGEKLQSAQKKARMYYFLGEGEKLVKEGKYQEALIPFLKAREAYDESPIPLMKIGDMFNSLHNIENAKLNYKLASERAPNDIHIWSKYIDLLIQSYEWEEASKAMDKFRKLPVSQSAIDKAAADMYQRQGRFIEAQTLYKRAMARESIDPGVYMAYAKSLMSTKNFKDAPFFFALSLRFDPLNVDAVINIAKCVAETEGIDRGISMLQDELRKGNGTRAEFLAAIAEMQIDKGAWEEAQQTLDQAIKISPDYAYSWKLQAKVYLNREGLDRKALDNALLAYKSFSDRNSSDPSGYIERYKLFAKKAEFEKAKDELTKIYQIYPKYPNLHYYLGALYAVQGNHKVAAEEFKLELTNNPNNVQTLIALGRELVDLEQFQPGLELFTKAMKFAPKSADAKQNAGWANYKMKNFQAAEALLQAALDLDKGNPAIYKRLGLVRRDMGDMTGACASFRKYIEMEPDAQDKAELQPCF